LRPRRMGVEGHHARSRAFGEPRSILAIPPAAVVLFGAVVWDGSLSHLDGALLLAGFVLAVLGLLWMSRRGIDIQPGGEVAETLAHKQPLGRWRALGLLVVSLAAIVIRSEMLATGPNGSSPNSGSPKRFSA